MTSHKQRNTLYAIISSLELDLRASFLNSVLLSSASSNVIPDDLRKRALDRWKANSDDANLPDPPREDLVPFFDLGDLTQCMQRGSSLLPSAVQQNFKKHREKIESLIPIRNRVMHSRPLEFDDYYLVTNLAKVLVSSLTSEWTNVRDTLRAIQKNPSFLDAINIPNTPEDPNVPYHNLPAPDFDDTGFLGRQREIEALKKAIRGPYPVVTLVGEGGVGKSALALKVAYEFLDEDTELFDAIVWTTAKANKLTTHEIISIEGAIKSSMGIFDSAAGMLGRDANSDPMTDLQANLKANKVLLVIDNLETILDENIRAFVNGMEGKSKILFTTRVGLGAYDFPITLSPFPPNEARHYLRRTCLVWGVNDIAKYPDARLDEYCKRLQLNPLFIKWFVQGISAGQRPDSLLANPKVLLKYCLQNVFDHLPDDAKNVAYTLLVLRSSQTQSALAFITELPIERLQIALSALISANIAIPQRAVNVEDDDTYYISQLATFYLVNYYAPSKEYQEHVLVRRSILRTEIDTIERRAGISVYSWYNIQPRNADDLLVCRTLADALRLMNTNEQESLRLADEACNLSPNFFEARRVRALILQNQGNLIQAETEFEAAISLNPRSAPLRVWFAGFMLRKKEDFDAAIEQLSYACTLDPEGLTPRLELARAQIFRRNYEDAKATLKSMQGTSSAPQKLQRQYLDLIMQAELRHAEDLAQVEQFAAALSCTLAAKKLFDEASPELIDGHVCEHAIKAGRGLLPALYRNFSNTPQSNVVEELNDWFRSIRTLLNEGANAPRRGLKDGAHSRGIMSSIHFDYGWIRVGSTFLFIHQSEWKGNIPFDQLQRGTPVVFEEGHNAKGPCAINVLVDELVVSSTPLIGKVVNVQRRENGFSFGFVEEANGSRFFFHKSHLIDPNEAESMRIGTKVCFRVGENNRGPCAVDVRIETG